MKISDSACMKKVTIMEQVKYLHPVNGNNCPICDNELNLIICNLAVYKRPNNFKNPIDYIPSSVAHCNKCNLYIARNEERKEFVNTYSNKPYRPCIKAISLIDHINKMEIDAELKDNYRNKIKAKLIIEKPQKSVKKKKKKKSGKWYKIIEEESTNKNNSKLFERYDELQKEITKRRKANEDYTELQNEMREVYKKIKNWEPNTTLGAGSYSAKSFSAIPYIDKLNTPVRK